jgi:putative DNA primase/helicase
MFYLVGERGRNGKGTMINGVADIIGQPLAQAVTMKAFTNKTADPQGFLIAPLHNSRMVIASEKSRGLTLDEELLKTVTGRDSIQVAFKGRDPFPFTPKFKLWLMANNPPRGDTSDDAFWSRMRPIIMPNSYQGKEDNTIKDRLRADEQRQSTLSWLVLGAIQWYRHGLGRADWIRTETQRIRAEQDTILQFADACLEASAGDDTPFSAVYTSYKNWCEAEGILAKANNHLAREMHLRGYKTDKRSVRVVGEVNPKKVAYLLNTRVTVQ